MREQLWLWRAQAAAPALGAGRWPPASLGVRLPTSPAANLNVQYQSGIWVPVKVPGEVSATAANPNDDTAL